MFQDTQGKEWEKPQSSGLLYTCLTHKEILFPKDQTHT